MKIPYWTLAAIPALSFGIGFTMNAIAVAVNGGQMPVQFPGGCDVMETVLAARGVTDIIHSCMTSDTHLKFLCDWILIRGVGVASPGDLLEWLSDAVATPFYSAFIALILNDYGWFKK